MTTRSLTPRFGLALLAAASFSPTTAAAQEAAQSDLTEWTIDQSHSQVGFTVTHLVVSEVDGFFRTFSGKILLDEKNLTKSQLELSIEVASVDTGNKDRDKHLRTGDFFDAEKHPKITFKSKAITKSGKGYKIRGDLTMRGVTKEVTLDAKLSEAITSPWGKQVRGAVVTGKLNRMDFGVSWNKALDKGGLTVGNDVEIELKFELQK